MSRTSSRVGLNIFRLLPVFAEVADQALGAARFARETHVASVQDEPVMRVLEILRRGKFQQFFFNGKYILAGCEAGAVRDAEDVRIDGDCRLPERGIEHD